MNVYMIQNTIDGTVYIGKANDPTKRRRAHLRNSCNPHLRSAMTKYGKDAFTFSILESFATEQEAYEQEEWWIEYLRSAGAVLYNIANGGEGVSSGCILSEAHKAKIGAASEGFRHSPATRAKMSAAATGRKLTTETRAKISATRSKNRYRWGAKAVGR